MVKTYWGYMFFIIIFFVSLLSCTLQATITSLPDRTHPIVIILDANTELSAGAATDTLAGALRDHNTPIITNKSVWQNFLRLSERYDIISTNDLKKEFDDLRIYEAPHDLYVIIPQQFEEYAHEKNTSPFTDASPFTKRELALGLKVDHLPKVHDPFTISQFHKKHYFLGLLSRIPSVVASSLLVELGFNKPVISFSSIFITQKDIAAQALVYWNIFLLGHGCPATISSKALSANLTVNEFKKLLTFLDIDLQTNYLYYSTCHGTESHRDEIFTDNGTPTRYSFPIVCEGLAGAVTLATSHKGHFRYLKRSLNDFLVASYFIHTQHTWEYEICLHNTPSIRYPNGTDFFYPEIVSDDGTYKVMHQSSLESRDAITIPEDLNVCFLNQPHLSKTIKVETHKKCLLTNQNPCQGIQTFDTIEALHLSLHDAINNLFLQIRGTASGRSKTVLIKKLLCKGGLYTNVSITRSSMKGPFESQIVGACLMYLLRLSAASKFQTMPHIKALRNSLKLLYAALLIHILKKTIDSFRKEIITVTARKPNGTTISATVKGPFLHQPTKKDFKPMHPLKARWYHYWFNKKMNLMKK